MLYSYRKISFLVSCSKIADSISTDTTTRNAEILLANKTIASLEAQIKELQALNKEL